MKQEKSKGIPLESLGLALIIMAITVLLATLKIYLSNQIYYESRTLNSLINEVEALKEENSILKTNVEKMRYKSEVTDTLFSLDDNKKSN